MNDHLQWFKSSYSDSSGGNCIEVAYDWRKSSYSDDSGGNCIEVAYDWRKSSHSNDSGGACIEVAHLHADTGTVHIRDSKNPEGPVIDVAPAAWEAFIAFSGRAGGARIPGA